MNKKIAIMSDSSSLIYAVKHNYKNIFSIDLPCFIGDERFADFEKNGNAVFFEALRNTNEIARTSQPSVGETMDMYTKIRNLGYTDIIYLPISKELSGTYQNAHLAKDLIEGVDVTIVDTLTTVSILGEMVLLSAKMAAENKDVEEIVKAVEELKDKWGFYVTVNDLTSLVKNGRLSNAKGFIANLLKIKPLIKFTQDGKLNAIQNIRTFKSALKAVADMVLNEVNPNNSKVFILYTDNVEDVEFVKEIVLAKYPKLNITIDSLSPTIVAHLGMAALGVGYINY